MMIKMLRVAGCELRAKADISAFSNDVTASSGNNGQFPAGLIR
jgi:hypothetical protein